MSGTTVRIRDEDTAGTWDAHERDGQIVLRVEDDPDREPVAELTLNRDDVIEMLVAIEMAEANRQPAPAA
jgi:hypothetical protein